MLQSLVKPMTRYLWSQTFPMVFWEQASQVMAGEVGVLASPWLSCKLAQIPSLIHPLPLWDAGWASHWVLGSEIRQWAPLRLHICLGTTKVLQRKLC